VIYEIKNIKATSPSLLDYTRRRFVISIFRRGFDSRHLHQDLTNRVK